MKFLESCPVLFVCRESLLAAAGWSPGSGDHPALPSAPALSWVTRATPAVLSVGQRDAFGSMGP